MPNYAPVLKATKPKKLRRAAKRAYKDAGGTQYGKFRNAQKRASNRTNRGGSPRGGVVGAPVGPGVML